MNIFVTSDKKFNLKSTTTIRDLKHFLTQNDFDVDTAKLTFSNGKRLAPIVFQSNQYDDVNFAVHVNYLKGSSLVVSKSKSKIKSLPEKSTTQYRNLPPDMKRMLIETVEPSEALALLDTVKYNNWKKLLNINYDFVTQGFAVGDTDEEKFKYLAKRVSKNISNNKPKIVFVHFNGKPMGEKRFLEYNRFLGTIIDDNFEDDPDNKITWRGIIDELKRSFSIEWVRYDNYNAWIKVKNSDELPTAIAINTGGRYKRIIRDSDLYDYPETRKFKVEIESGIAYPGIVDITTERILKLPENIVEVFDLEGDAFPENMETMTDDILDYIMDMGYTTKEYAVYKLMELGFDRIDSEIIIKILIDGRSIEFYKSYIKYMAEHNIPF